MDSGRAVSLFERRVSPFGYLRIKGWLPPPRSFSQAPASFIAATCRGIHHMLLVWFHHNRPKENGQSWCDAVFFVTLLACLIVNVLPVHPRLPSSRPNFSACCLSCLDDGKEDECAALHVGCPTAARHVVAKLRFQRPLLAVFDWTHTLATHRGNGVEGLTLGRSSLQGRTLRKR